MKKRGDLVIFLVFILIFNILFLALTLAIEESQSYEEIIKELEGKDKEGTSPTINDLPSQIYVCEGDILDYPFSITDEDGESLDIGIDSERYFNVFPKFSTRSEYVDAKLFSDVLNKSTVGDHDMLVYVTDGDYLDTKQVRVSVIEINNPPIVENIKVKTILSDSKNFYYPVKATDLEDGDQDSGNLKFHLYVLSGTSFLRIDEKGSILGTTNRGLVGVHNFEVCVSDSGIEDIHPNINLCNQDGKSATTCINLSLTVTNENRPPVITLNNPKMANESFIENDMLFNITKHDPDGTIPDAYWYLDGELKQYSSGSSTDSFDIEYICKVGENHSIRVAITDGLLNNSLRWDLNIKECPIAEGSGETFAEKIKEGWEATRFGAAWPLIKKIVVIIAISVGMIILVIIFIKARDIFELKKQIPKRKGVSL